MRKPILVTGAHRSGTTWVGKMLSPSSEVAYISEPLNVHHRPGVLKVPTQKWYTYICEQNQSIYLSALQETLSYSYHPWLEIKSLRSFKDVGRMFRDLSWFTRGRLQNARPLLKDPFAVFSVPWFAQALGCQAIILVRHPLAFVSSLKRLQWAFDFQDLLSQPLLMCDHLEPFRDQMKAIINKSDDVINQGSLLWQMVYSVVDGFRSSFPEFVVVRHEDLSRDPEGEFRDLYATLELTFTPKVQQALKNSSQRGNPEELSSHRVHEVQLDSKANLSNWKKRLTHEEIKRIRHITEDVAEKFYLDESWE